MMKILNIHPHLSVYGGAEILLANLTKELILEGHECLLLTLSIDDDVRVNFHPSVTFVLPEKKCKYSLRSLGFFSALGYLSEIYNLYRLTSIFNKKVPDCDFVILHNFPSSWMASVFDCPVIWMCNEPPMICNNDNPGKMLSLLVRIGAVIDRKIVRSYVDRLVVSDAFNRDRVHDRYGVDSIINNYGVDYKKFSAANRTNILEEFGLSDSSCTVLQVGVFSPQKNQIATLKAFDNLLRVNPEAMLIFAGDDANDYGRLVLEKTVDMNIKDRVVSLGRLDQGQICALYHAADFVVFPTLAQGGWLSPFEAVCAGARVVVSETFTASHIIEENLLGCVLKDFENDFVGCVLGWQEQELLDRHQRALWVRENLSWRRYSTRFCEIAASLVAKACQ